MGHLTCLMSTDLKKTNHPYFFGSRFIFTRKSEDKSWWVENLLTGWFFSSIKHKQGKSEGFDSCDRPRNLKLDSNRQFFHLCDLEIWWMTLQNNRAPLLCYFKLCASFRSHWWIQTGVTVRKRPIWVKFDDFFLAVWPWNLTDDLAKQ